MKQQIQSFFKKEYSDIDFDVFYPPRSAGRGRKASPAGGFGDYSTNAVFVLAKKTGKAPKDIARELVEKLKKEFSEEFKEIKVEKGGFINFYLDPDFLRKRLEIIYKNKANYGKSEVGKGQTALVEYSQPNIAKIMHVGHLRSTLLGDALANIFENLGYKTVRWNYLGDWGTQFGNLIAAYKLWGGKKEVEENPIETLNNLYVRFHVQLKSNPGFKAWGREEFKKLEEGDKENKKLWQWFREESLRDFNKIYEILGVKFDTMISESFFEKDLKPLISELLDKGIAKTSEGAVVVPLDNYGLPPALIRKKDGTSLYLTRDIANLRFRVKEYKPSKILYVVGNEQSLHFQQLFKIAEILGLVQGEGSPVRGNRLVQTKLIHVKFGLILGKDKRKMSTREGRVIQMIELIEKAIELAGKIVEEKNPELSEKEKEEVAKAVGVGALKYFILKEHRNTDIVFDWDKMLDFTGASGPYLQYTYARLRSILNKAGEIGKADFRALTEEIELAIIGKLLNFTEVIISSSENYLTNNLALYLYELANLANKFYEAIGILKDENEKRRNGRLVLIDVLSTVLRKGLNTLGIRVLEKI